MLLKLFTETVNSVLGIKPSGSVISVGMFDDYLSWLLVSTRPLRCKFNFPLFSRSFISKEMSWLSLVNNNVNNVCWSAYSRSDGGSHIRLLAPDSSPVVVMLRDARGTGARGVIARGDGTADGTTHHTSHSCAARFAEHEDDWGRVSSTPPCRLLLL